MSRLSAPGVFLRGLAMGMADLVPGVSGGTVALISGIYPRLLAAIAACDGESLQLLRRGQWHQFWLHIDGAFLLPLLLGIGTAILGLAGVLKILLDNHALLVWSFFCGLVLASSLFLLRDELGELTLKNLGFLVAGIALMLVVGLGPGMAFPHTLWGFFLAGMIGICAMILPGISGSFILVLLGMYSAVITAVVARDFAALLIFGLGCFTGLLAFSRLLVWVLDRARQATLSLLIGFLLGSLVILWPWQQATKTVAEPSGAIRILQTLPVSPAQYELLSGDSQWLACLLSTALGAALVGCLQIIAKRTRGAERGGNA